MDTSITVPSDIKLPHITNHKLTVIKPEELETFKALLERKRDLFAERARPLHLPGVQAEVFNSRFLTIDPEMVCARFDDLRIETVDGEIALYADVYKAGPFGGLLDFCKDYPFKFSRRSAIASTESGSWFILVTFDLDYSKETQLTSLDAS